MSQQDSSILYAGSAAGGVFKSTDGGIRWTPLWSNQESLAIGGLSVAPSNHDVVYASTGEWEGGVSSTPYHHFSGVGVYRATDGGSQWTLCPIPSEWTAAAAWQELEIESNAAIRKTLSITRADPRILLVVDRGSATSLDTGLPNCFVSDLDVHAPSFTLYAATMGRGIYRRQI